MSYSNADTMKAEILNMEPGVYSKEHLSLSSPLFSLYLAGGWVGVGHYFLYISRYLLTGQSYIGSSVNLGRRFREYYRYTYLVEIRTID